VKRKKKIPTEFACECGVTYMFPIFLYGQWWKPWVHTCGYCRRVHEILCGKVRLLTNEETL